MFVSVPVLLQVSPALLLHGLHRRPKGGGAQQQPQTHDDDSTRMLFSIREIDTKVLRGAGPAALVSKKGGGGGSSRDASGTAAAAASFNHEQAARVRARQLILQYSGALLEATKDEIRWLKQTGVLGLRAPKSSLMSAHHLMQLLREHNKIEVAEQLQATIDKFSKRRRGAAAAKPRQAAHTADMDDDDADEEPEHQSADHELESADSDDEDPTAIDDAAADGAITGSDEDDGQGEDDDQAEARKENGANHAAAAAAAAGTPVHGSARLRAKRKNASSANQGHDPDEDLQLASSYAASSAAPTSAAAAAGKRSRKTKELFPSSVSGFDALPSSSVGASSSREFAALPLPAASSRPHHTRRRSSLRAQDMAAAAAASQRELLATLAFAEFVPNPRDMDADSDELSGLSGPAVRFGSDHSGGVSVRGDNGCIVVGPAAGFGTVRATHGLRAGSWYIEVKGAADDIAADQRAKSEEDRDDAAATAATAAVSLPSAVAAASCRVGFATLHAALDSKLGSDDHGYAYEDRYGDKIHAGLAVAYGAPFVMQPHRHSSAPESRQAGAADSAATSAAASAPDLSSPLSSSFLLRRGDVIGLLLELDPPALLSASLHDSSSSSAAAAAVPPPPPVCNRLSFYKNGSLQGVAYSDIAPGQCWFPAATLSNGAAIRFDFRAADKLTQATTPKHRAAAAAAAAAAASTAHSRAFAPPHLSDSASSLLLPSAASALSVSSPPPPLQPADLSPSSPAAPAPASRVLFHSSRLLAPSALPTDAPMHTSSHAELTAAESAAPAASESALDPSPSESPPSPMQPAIMM